MVSSNRQSSHTAACCQEVSSRRGEGPLPTAVPTDGRGPESAPAKCPVQWGLTKGLSPLKKTLLGHT